jgi:hypothetical protein
MKIYFCCIDNSLTILTRRISNLLSISFFLHIEYYIEPGIPILYFLRGWFLNSFIVIKVVPVVVSKMAANNYTPTICLTLYMPAPNLLLDVSVLPALLWFMFIDI